MRLYWVRHGEQELGDRGLPDLEGVNRLFNQQVQGPLSEAGWGQAQAVLNHFGRQPVDALYSSPLIRARQTAGPTAAELDMPIEILPELEELHPGELPEGSAEAMVFEALSRLPLVSDEVRRKLLGAFLIPMVYRSWRLGRTDGGETPAGFEARIRSVVDRLRERHPADARVALFAHGYVIFTLATALMSARRDQLRALLRPYVANGSITEVSVDPAGQLRLVRYAGRAHL